MGRKESQFSKLEKEPISLDRINALLTESAKGRKQPIHKTISNENSKPIIFLTVCTKNRKTWLIEEGVFDVLIDTWNQASAWQVGKLTIMPDHVHLFVRNSKAIDLGNWVRYWKSQFSKKISNDQYRWQPDYWDRQVKSQEEYQNMLHYMCQNPVRAELVDSADDWPFSGELNEFL